MQTTNDNLVPAALYSSVVRANIALGMLRANGIPCVLYGEMASSVLGIQLSPSDSIRLMVRECDLDTALNLLSASGDLDDEML